jgi:hypothetical protein
LQQADRVDEQISHEATAARRAGLSASVLAWQLWRLARTMAVSAAG